MLPDDELTFLGRTTARNAQRLFGIRHADRRHHLHIIGQTGTGKSTLLNTLIRQDLVRGHGLALLDPHGDLAEQVRAGLPPSRRAALTYLDLPDVNQAFTFNPIERVPAARRTLAAASVLDVFKKLWADSWGPRLEHVLRNALLVLIELPEATLGDVLRLFDDPDFRETAAKRCSNPQVRRFWLREYPQYPRGCGRMPSPRCKTRWARSSRTPACNRFSDRPAVPLTCAGLWIRAASCSSICPRAASGKMSPRSSARCWCPRSDSRPWGVPSSRSRSGDRSSSIWMSFRASRR